MLGVVYLQFLHPITGLVFGTGILLDEVSTGAVPYLFTRPSPRAGLLLGKFAASVLCGAAALSLSLAGFIVLSGGAMPGDTLPLRAFGAVSQPCLPTSRCSRCSGSSRGGRSSPPSSMPSASRVSSGSSPA